MGKTILVFAGRESLETAIRIWTRSPEGQAAMRETSDAVTRELERIEQERQQVPQLMNLRVTI